MLFRSVFESNPAEPIEITMETNRKVTICIENPVPINANSHNDILTVDLCPKCLRDYCNFLSDPNVQVYDSGLYKIDFKE